MRITETQARLFLAAQRRFEDAKKELANAQREVDCVTQAIVGRDLMHDELVQLDVATLILTIPDANNQTTLQEEAAPAA